MAQAQHEELERHGVISHKRGRIIIVDRDALVQVSNGTFSDGDLS